jgi:hypothetical protein
MSRARILAVSAVEHLRRLSLDPSSPRHGAAGHVGRASNSANAAFTKCPSAEVRAWALRVAELDKVWMWRGISEATRKNLLASVETLPPLDTSHETLTRAKRLSEAHVLARMCLREGIDYGTSFKIVARPCHVTLGFRFFDTLDALGVCSEVCINDVDTDGIYFRLKPSIKARLLALNQSMQVEVQI